MTVWSTWLEGSCVRCRTRFIFDYGDQDDYTAFYPNEVKCFSCGHINIIDESEDHDDDYESDPGLAETSYPVPR